MTTTHRSRLALKIVAAGALVVSSVAANAATVSASASVDWSGFSISFVGGSLGYTLASPGSSVFASNSEGASVSDGAPDWSTALTALAVSSMGTGNASTGSAQISSATSWTPAPDTLNSTNGRAARFGDISVTGTGSGLIIVSAPATVSASIVNLDASNYATFASGDVFLRISKGTLVSTGDLFATVADEVKLVEHSDLIAAVLSVAAGDVIHFDIQASTYSQGGATPVPVPAGVFLLAPALVALGAVRRRAA